MENVLDSNILYNAKAMDKNDKIVTNLSQAAIDEEYTIKKIIADDEDLIGFLFTLGCYEGEHVTLISKLAENYVISVKDARYSIDQELAEAIII